METIFGKLTATDRQFQKLKEILDGSSALLKNATKKSSETLDALNKVLHDPTTEVTLFAPCDSAFSYLMNYSNAIQSDIPGILLRNHVRKITAFSDLKDLARKGKMYNNRIVKEIRDDIITLGSAKVYGPGYEAAKSLIIEVDELFIPDLD